MKKRFFPSILALILATSFLGACGDWSGYGFSDYSGGQSKVIVNNTSTRMCACDTNTCFCLEPGASITIYY